MPTATKDSAAPFVPPKHTLPILAKAVQKCRGCPLYANATQAVFGEGKPHARILFIGEQPGDKEDLAGHPFIGPAGQMLDQCLQAAGIDRAEAYVTNAVKHFKWKPAGKRRLHDKPSMREIRACRPWLDAEIDALHPALIVTLGATAAQSLLGPAFRVTKQRGQRIDAPNLPPILTTIHPSAILRARTSEDRHRETEAFIADLKAARKLL